MKRKYDLIRCPEGFMLIIEEGGKRLPLIDGHAGDIHIFSKGEVHAWQYGARGTSLGHTMSFLQEIEP